MVRFMGMDEADKIEAIFNSPRVTKAIESAIRIALSDLALFGKFHPGRYAGRIKRAMRDAAPVSVGRVVMVNKTRAQGPTA